MKRADRGLQWFADWFASRAGVLQTAFLVLVVVVYEAAFPHADQHGFWLLYWLTVYSAVTQPVLAYCSRRASEKADRDVAALKAEEDQILGVLVKPEAITHEDAS